MPLRDYNKIECTLLDDIIIVGCRMEYLSSSQVAEKWGIKQRRIRVLCVEGRIPGACKVGTCWLIPEDAKKPKDERIKSGKYIKKKAVE